MPKGLTDEQAQQRLKEAQGDKIIFVDKYINSRTKIHFKCTDCGSILYCVPNDLFTKKTSCPYCSKHHKYTADECEELLNKLYKGKVRLNKETYKNTNEPSELSCRDCGYVWNTSVSHLLRRKNPKEGSGCPRCSHKIQLTFQQVRELVQTESNGMYDIIESTFKNASTKAKATCINGHEWWVKPIDMYGKRKYGCPYCYNHIKWTADEAQEHLDLFFGKDIVRFNKDEYKNTHNLIDLYCPKNHVWKSSIHTALQGHGCPICIKYSLEEPVTKILNKKHVNYTSEKKLEGCFYKSEKFPLKADFFFNDVPLVIETDGQQHMNPTHGLKRLKEQQERDTLKNMYLKERGYVLIRVTSSPTKEWGFKNHITLAELLHLIEIGIDDNGNVNLDVFRPYDFNRE